MKHLLKYTGVFSLMIFSFFYTEKAINYTNRHDPLMNQIINYKGIETDKCVEGMINNDEVILGVNGKKVDVNRSYTNMKGMEYDEELLVFSEDKCEITKEKNKDKYIIKGNPYKNTISFIFVYKNKAELKIFINNISNKENKFTIALKGSDLKEELDYFKTLNNIGYDFIYYGNDEKDLKLYLKMLKKINKKSEKFCLTTINNNNFKLCKENNLNTIKSDLLYKEFYITGKNLQRGDILAINTTEYIKKEFNTTIKYINSKGIDINNLTNHLS